MRSMLSPGLPVIVADCVVFGVEHSGAVFPSSAKDLNFYLHSFVRAPSYSYTSSYTESFFYAIPWGPLL